MVPTILFKVFAIFIWDGELWLRLLLFAYVEQAVFRYSDVGIVRAFNWDRAINGCGEGNGSVLVEGEVSCGGDVREGKVESLASFGRWCAAIKLRLHARENHVKWHCSAEKCCVFTSLDNNCAHRLAFWQIEIAEVFEFENFAAVDALVYFVDTRRSKEFKVTDTVASLEVHHRCHDIDHVMFNIWRHENTENFSQRIRLTDAQSRKSERHVLEQSLAFCVRIALVPCHIGVICIPQGLQEQFIFLELSGAVGLGHPSFRHVHGSITI